MKFYLLVIFTIFDWVKNAENKDNNFIVFFDLDYTLWPFWVDTHVSPPFTIKEINEKGEKIIEDEYGFEIKLYPEVMKVLEKAKSEGIIMGTISRTCQPGWGRQLLKLFDIEKYFISTQFDTGTKTNSMKKIMKMAGIDGGFENCILYDDEARNIIDIEDEGGVGVLINNGLNIKEFEKGIKILKSRKLKK